jgi:ADP-ribose pyrophosphatase
LFEVLEELPTGVKEGFLRLRRQRVVVRFADGTVSEPFLYDSVDRFKLDAIVIAAHFRDASGVRQVFLRSSLRPSLLTRPSDGLPFPEKETLGGLWELPAGLVEEDERSPEGLRRCAARELFEEIGVEVDPEAIKPLGPSCFPAPGIIGERHFFFHVELEGPTRVTPTEDGSALEKQAIIAPVALDEALALVRRGEIEDEKTELGLRRLAEI